MEQTRNPTLPSKRKSNGPKIVLIGCVMMFIGVAWSLSNMIGSVTTAQSEADDALKECLDAASYTACRDASMRGCMNHMSYVECKQHWMDQYERVTGA